MYARRFYTSSCTLHTFMYMYRTWTWRIHMCYHEGLLLWNVSYQKSNSRQWTEVYMYVGSATYSFVLYCAMGCSYLLILVWTAKQLTWSAYATIAMDCSYLHILGRTAKLLGWWQEMTPSIGYCNYGEKGLCPLSLFIQGFDWSPHLA